MSGDHPHACEHCEEVRVFNTYSQSVLIVDVNTSLGTYLLETKATCHMEHIIR